MHNLYIHFCYLLLVLFLISSNIAEAKKPDSENRSDISFELVAGQRREEIKKIVEKHSIFREFKNVEYKSNIKVVEFMMDHPVFLSVILKAMKIRNYLVKLNDDGTYSFKDMKGISSEFEFIHKGFLKRYYYGSAIHEGKFLTVAGRGVGFLEYYSEEGNTQKTYVNGYIYGTVDNIVIELLIKLMKPFIHSVIERKTNKFINQTKTLAEQITKEPDRVCKAVKDSGLADEVELAEFKKLIEAQEQHSTAEKKRYQENR